MNACTCTKAFIIYRSHSREFQEHLLQQSKVNKKLQISEIYIPQKSAISISISKLEENIFQNEGKFDTRKSFVEEKWNRIPKVINLDFNLVMKKARKGAVYRSTTQSGLAETKT